MRFRRSTLWAAGLFGLAIALTFWMYRPSPRPNILLITLDTTRADRLGCYGFDLAKTPQFDRLAQEGTLFERAYATAPMTAPSHASIFTGLFPPEHGVYTNGLVKLDADLPVVAELLRLNGYGTSAFVASVVLQATSGFERGFDVYDDDLSSAEMSGDDMHRSRDGKHVVDAAVNWLEHRPQSKSPFFCWVHLYDPHEPYLAHNAEFGQTFHDRPYDGEIAYVDQQVEHLLAALDRLKLREDTVIVVAGDHGESLGEHGEETHGFMLHESTLRVPLIIANPRSSAGTRRVATPVPLVDLFATLLEFADAKATVETYSRSLIPAMSGQPLPQRVCYSQTLEPYVEAGWSPLQGLTTDRWRYVRTTIPELYDLTADPGELRNLSEELPDRVIELDGELAEFESRFQTREGGRRTLSEREQRSLESLGYAGAGSSDAALPTGDSSRPDIKEMIVHLNQLLRATELMEKQQFDEAAELLQPLAENVPNFLRPRSTLGLCRLKQGRFEEAVQWLEAALEIDPNYERARVLAGFAHLKLRQLDQAEAHLQHALELNSESENAHMFLGEIAQRREQFPVAMRYYAEALRINPRNRQAREALTALQAAGIRP